MLGFFKKSPPEDGVLSNLKTVTKWVQDLPAGDIYSAQEKVVQNLIQFNHSDKGYSKDRLQVLMHLDEETRDMQASLCQQYLRNARMSKSIESRLWIAIHAFYWEVTRSYHGFLMDFVANPGGSKIQGQVPLITARAIRGFADIIKWRYFRYEKMDDKLWLRLHNLYRIAEFDNFSNTAVLVYRTDKEQQTAAREYGQAMLLSPFGAGNLVPREIEMVDHWLDNWSGDIRIDAHFNPDQHAFYIDTSKGHGIKRCRNQAPEPALRFISTQAIQARIERIREALKNGTSAASLGLTEDFRLPEGYHLLNQVESEWSQLDQRDRRGHSRLPKSGQWKIIHDLANIGKELNKAVYQGKSAAQAQLTPEEILDIKLYGFVTERTKQHLAENTRTINIQSKQEVWQQNDVSETGISFLIGQMDSEWVKVGKLVAFSPANDTRWNLGVISRLAREDGGRRLIGVRLMPGSPQAVDLKPDASDTVLSYIVDEPDYQTSDQNYPAILLDDDKDKHLIIESAAYSRDRKYLLRGPKMDSRAIRLEAVSETGESWLRVGFSVVGI
jgi:cyclic-di-GMP-binding protein